MDIVDARAIVKQNEHQVARFVLSLTERPISTALSMSLKQEVFSGLPLTNDVASASFNMMRIIYIEILEIEPFGSTIFTIARLIDGAISFGFTVHLAHMIDKTILPRDLTSSDEIVEAVPVCYHASLEF